MNRRAALRVFARLSLWSALAFILNLIWEIAHVRLYTIWMAADGPAIAWAILHCSLGDMVIALTMFVLTGAALRHLDWPRSRPWTGDIIFVTGAVTFTAWSEWHNVYSAGNWGYTESMPTIFGVGLSPLLQWVILPPLITAAYRAVARALDMSSNGAGVRYGKA